MTDAAFNSHSSSKPSGIDETVLSTLLSGQWVSHLQLAMTNSKDTTEYMLHEFQRFRDAGCEIEEDPVNGFRLLRSGLGVWVDYLRFFHGDNRLIEVYRQTASTQDAVRRLIDVHGRGAHGALAIADHQSAGRGRLGRSWVAPADSAVLVSLAHVGPPGAALQPNHLAIAAAVAVARACLDCTAVPTAQGLRQRHDIRIKWPNDILVGGRKLAGILIEALPQQGAAIIGIGLNVSLTVTQMPADLQDRVTSLRMLGASCDRLLVLSALVRELDRALSPDADKDALVRAWRDHNHFSGNEPVTFKCDGRTIRGCVLDVDADAGLIVRMETGELVNLPAATTSVVA